MIRQTKQAVLEILDLYTAPDGNDRLILAITHWLPDKDYERASKLLINNE